jgi:L-threonylcarbamoyladenylate synthase
MERRDHRTFEYPRKNVELPRAEALRPRSRYEGETSDRGGRHATGGKQPVLHYYSVTNEQVRYLTVDPEQPDAEIVRRAGDVLRSGGLVAFPTETVYGLGANALDASAVARIFSAKGRPTYDPLIVHVLNASGARAVAREWPDAAERLATTFWPGPLTVVVPKQPVVPDIVTAGLDTVAVRVPSHPVARAILEAAAVPIAAPSANRFTEISPTRAEHVARTLGDRVDLIIDGGPTTVGIESTVVDVSGERPVLLRPGMIPVPALLAALGSLGIEVAVAHGDGAAPRRSPGMLDRHYAPRARLEMFDNASRTRAVRSATERAAAGDTVGALLVTPFDAPVRHALEMPNDPAAYARVLYHALHTLDAAGCDVVFVEDVPCSPAWAGVRDRLTRATRPAPA